MKPNKETYVEYIMKYLQKGGIERKGIVSEFIKKFQVTDRTFDRYWKMASERYQGDIQQLQEARAEQLAVEGKESVKRDIADKFERMEIASKIARGVSRKVGGMLITPSDSDRLNACRYLSQLEGDFKDTEDAPPVHLSFNLSGYELKSDKL